MDNPQTSIFVFLVWIIYYLGVYTFHYKGNLKDNEILVSLLLSFILAFITTFFYSILLLFSSITSKYYSMRKNNWLVKKIPDIKATSELSKKIFACCFNNFWGALISYAICFLFKFSFQTFMLINLLILIIRLLENTVIAIFINRNT